MTEKAIKEKDKQIQVMIGTWLDGQRLQHLQLIDDKDSTDEHVREILEEIETVYESGIKRGVRINLDMKNTLLDNLTKKGYDRTDLCAVIDDAKGCDTEYTAAVAKLLKHKRIHKLENIDWSDKNADEQAKAINKKYTIEGATPLKTPNVNLVDDYEAVCKEYSDTPPIDAGTPYLTHKTGGFRPGMLISIGARPGIGKTSWSLQIAYNAAKKGFKVLHLPEEMPDTEMMGKLYAIESDGILHTRKMDKFKDLTDYELSLYNEIKPRLRKLTSENLLFIEGEIELQNIKKQIEIHRPDLLIIDQLTQLNDSTASFEDKRNLDTHILINLKSWALEYNLVIILAAQINRTGGKSTRPVMSDFKDCGTIEESSDACFILDPDKEDADIMNIYIDKFRRIDIESGFCVKTVFDKTACKFTDIPGKHLTELAETAPEARYAEMEKEKEIDGQINITGFTALDNEDIPF